LQQGKINHVSLVAVPAGERVVFYLAGGYLVKAEKVRQCSALWAVVVPGRFCEGKKKRRTLKRAFDWLKKLSSYQLFHSYVFSTQPLFECSSETLALAMIQLYHCAEL